MAEGTGVNNKPPIMELDNRQENEAVGNALPTRQPTLNEIEFQASQVIERFDEAGERAQEGNDEEPGGQSWKHYHGLLPLASKTSNEIIAMLEDMIVHEDYASTESTPDEESIPNLAILPQLDPISQMAIVSHSMVAYASGLERSHLQHLHARIAGDTTRWLSGLFRFFDCGAFYHDDVLEGIVRLTRMMLHYKYPKYLEDGFDALTTRPPIIYSSVASPLGVVQHICRQLGLPMFCVRPVPCNTMFGSQQKIDVAALERLIEEDKMANRVPLIILADAGTPIAGHVDNLARLQELCKQHDIWLHLRGHCLAALAMTVTQDVSPRVADSLTLPIGTWLGIPALPVITLYRDLSSQRSPRSNASVGAARETTLALMAGLRVDQFTRRLNSLPLWTVLQVLGREGVMTRLRQAFECVEEVWRRVTKYQCLRILSPEPGGEGRRFRVQELMTNPVSSNFLFDVVSCTVVFQFVPAEPMGTPPLEGRIDSYYDKLNSWLGQILQRDAPQLPIEISDLESSGVVLRYCPLENGTERLPSLAEMDSFADCLEQQLDILIATVQHKETFQRLVVSSPRLRLVEMPGWAGLGGVQYVPEAWEQLLTDQAKDELNKLNMTLVDSLRHTDAAFSLGEGMDNLVCVRFGMVTAETDVEELLGLVVVTGKEVEESSKFLDTMTEIVKKGIEAVTLDLQKENQERIWQEGILRHVPVFGSLVNWWSPPSKEGGIKGRSLNLQAGVVESTENIYRYHMQLQQGANAAPGGRGPPTPQVQTTVAPPASNHSRSSSHSSQRSQPAVQQQPDVAAPTPPPTPTSTS